MIAVPNHISNKRLLRAGRLALITLAALSLLVAALPQPVQAATEASAPCASTYLVKKGDSKSSIAHNFGLGWWEIAKANDLLTSEALKVGQTLCIPLKGWATQTAAGTMSVFARGSAVVVTVSDFDARFLWTVKAKDTTGKVSGDYKLGRIVIPKNTKVTQVFLLPDELKNAPYLTVCLKNLTSNARICRYIIHVP